MQLWRTVVERRVKDEWKDVRAYVVMAEDAVEARDMTPTFASECVRVVEEQVKSPWVYLLPGV